MKKLFASRGFAGFVLVVVALAAIPLLGGLKLSAQKNRIEKRLEQATHAEKFDINTDVKSTLNYAEKLLQEGIKISSSENSASVDLTSAIKACTDAIADADKYEKALELVDKANAYYGSLGSLSSTTLDDIWSAVNSQRERIVNGYRAPYDTYSTDIKALFKGFPASYLAKLFKLNG